jgi:hypothetical protein
VYEGVDVAWYGNQGQLEYDFLVRPGVDPNGIRLRFEGTQKLALEASGDVRIETAAGAMKLRLPVVYQQIAGERKRIEGRYRLRAANEIGFELAAYDTSKQLVIDPTLVYGTYFGTGLTMLSVATDTQGNVYIGGYEYQSSAGGLPVVNAMQGSVLGYQNAFVAKFDPTGTAVLYSTYIGGSGSDSLSALAVDGSGEVVGTGSTSSIDFPLTNPVQSQGDKDGLVFALKLNAAGSALVYSTYLGASRSYGSAVAVDGAGNSYITGSASTGFPASTGAAQTTFGGGTTDAFAAKLGADGKLIYATLLGGSGADQGTAIVADAQGNAYVAGGTQSNSFPSSLPGAKAGSGGGMDAFVAKLPADGSAISWLAILGGSGDDYPAALVRNASGTLYVAGRTTSADLPTTAGVIQASSNGPKQGFVASLAADGMSFGFVTYLGGGKEDSVAGMALASSGQLALVGSTSSTGFPTVNAIQPTFGGNGVSLYKGANGGASWTPADTGLPSSVVALSTDPSHSGTVLAAMGPGGNSFDLGVFRTTNAGASWTAASARTPVSMWFSQRTTQIVRTPANPAVVYLAYPYLTTAGPGGTTNYLVAFGSSDGGATWRTLAQPPASAGASYLAGMAVSTTDANTIAELDYGGNVFRSTDGGASLTKVGAVPGGIPFGYSPVAAGPGGSLFVGTNSGIYKSPDFGLTWTPLSPNFSPNYFAISPSNPSVIYVVRGWGGITKSTDGGASWNAAITQPPGVTLGGGGSSLQVAPDNSQVLCASDYSSVTVSMDGGASWSTPATVPGWPIAGAVAVDSAGTVYAADSVAADAFVAKLSADGKTLLWSTFYTGSYGSWPAGVATTASGDVWIAGSGSTGLPITPNAMYSNGSDFLARISDATPACSYSIAPSSAISDSYGDPLSFAVTAPSGCAWTATASDSSWITVTSGASGTGIGAVSLTLAANSTGATRTGSVNVNGQSFTITQPDSSCGFASLVSNTTLPAAGGTFPFTISAAPGCPWTVTPLSPVVSVVSGGSGIGQGTVTLSLAPNGGPQPLTANVLVNLRQVSLHQASGCQFSVSPAALGNAAGSGTLAVIGTPAGCSWSNVSSSDPWLSVSRNGSDSGTVLYTVQANTGAPRTTHINFSNPPSQEQFSVPITQTVVPLQFVPVTPCRVADTRNPEGPFGGPTMTEASTRSFAIPESACGIPSTAQAYSLNVTVVPQRPLSFLKLWPDGQPPTNVSTLNSDGGVVANAAIVAAGTGGAVDVYVTDPTDVILDINGYFDRPSAATAAFYTATPCRIADTRFPDGPFGGPSLGARGSRDFAVSSSACGIPSGVDAYSLNVTAVPDGVLAFLTAWPTGEQRPLVSTLNSFGGSVVANAAIVPSGIDDSVSVYAFNPTDAILDVNGFFARGGRAGALSFYPVTPCRIADTRFPDGPFAGPMLEAGTTRSFGIPASACNIPSTAAAYALNVTVVPNGTLWYLTVWPTGVARPNVSTLNSWEGLVVANAAIVPAGAGGAISVYASGRTHVILDISGYFAP